MYFGRCNFSQASVSHKMRSRIEKDECVEVPRQMKVDLSWARDRSHVPSDLLNASWRMQLDWRYVAQVGELTVL